MTVLQDECSRDLDVRLDGDWPQVMIEHRSFPVCPVCFAMMPEYVYLNGTYFRDLKKRHIEWHRDG